MRSRLLISSNVVKIRGELFGCREFHRCSVCDGTMKSDNVTYFSELLSQFANYADFVGPGLAGRLVVVYDSIIYGDFDEDCLSRS